MQNHENERELIMKASKGDLRAFKQIFEIYNPKLTAICRNEGLTEEQCAAVSKKTFEAAARKLSEISTPEEFIRELKSICAKNILEVKPKKTVSPKTVAAPQKEARTDEKPQEKKAVPSSADSKAGDRQASDVTAGDRKTADGTAKGSQTAGSRVSDKQAKEKRRTEHKEKKALEKKTIKWIVIAVAALMVIGSLILLLPGRSKRATYEVPYNDSLKDVYKSYISLLQNDRPMILNVNSMKDSRQYLPTVAVYDINRDNVPELIYVSNSLDYVRHLSIYTVKGGITQELFSDYCYDLCGMFVSGNDVYILMERNFSAVETSFMKLVSAEDGTIRLERVLYSVGTSAVLADGSSETLYAYYQGDQEIGRDAFIKAYKKICSGMTLALMDINSPESSFMDEKGGYREKFPELQNAAMDCDSAIEKLMVLTGQGSTILSPSELLANLPQHFVYTDGSGTWATELEVYSDGSFNGTYHSYSQNGDRTIQQCLFRGVFSDITSIDGYSYRATLKHLEILETTEHYDVNGYYVVPGDPAGITGGAEYIIHRPGTFKGRISSQAFNWASWKFNPRSSLVLPCWAIVSSNTGEAFFDDETVLYTPAAEGSAPPPPDQTEETEDEYDEEDYEESYEDDDYESVDDE